MKRCGKGFKFSRVGEEIGQGVTIFITQLKGEVVMNF
jgi:hypothetical protein